MQAGLLAGDPHGEVELARSCYQQLRGIYAATTNLHERRTLAEKIIAGFPPCPVPRSCGSAEPCVPGGRRYSRTSTPTT